MLSAAERAALWAGSPWLGRVDREQIEAAAALSRQVVVPRGTELSDGGTARRDVGVSLIVDGRVRIVSRGRGQRFQKEAYAGELVGLDGAVARARGTRVQGERVVALSDVTVLLLPGDRLDKLPLGFLDALGRAGTLEAMAPGIVEWLAGTGWFEHVRKGDLRALVLDAVLLALGNAEEHLLVDAVAYVADGAVTVARPDGYVRDPTGTPVCREPGPFDSLPIVDMLKAGNGTGVAELTDRSPLALRASAETRGCLIPVAAFRDLGLMPRRAVTVTVQQARVETFATARRGHAFDPLADPLADPIANPSPAPGADAPNDAHGEAIDVAPLSLPDDPVYAPAQESPISFDQAEFVASQQADRLPRPSDCAHAVIVLIVDPALRGSARRCPTATALSVHLADRIRRDFGDRVLSLRFSPKCDDGPPTFGGDDDATFRDWFALRNDRAWLMKHDAVVLDATEFGDDLQALVREIDRLPVPARIAYFFDEPASWKRRLLLLGHRRRAAVLPVAVLGAPAPSLPRDPKQLADAIFGFRETPAYRAGKALLARWRGDAAKPISEDDAGPQQIAVQVLPSFPPLRVLRESWPIEAVRMRFAPQGDGEMQPGSAEYEASIGRLARATTGRRVGVALGGAGALSLAAIPLLRELERLGIPIDALSGTSCGGILGAFFAAEGWEGVDKLMANRNAVLPLLQTSFTTNAALGFWVDGLLGSRDVNDLDVPMHTIATDAADFSEFVMKKGTLGLAVRATGNLPPYAPVVVAGHRLIDGAYANDVPGRVLRDAGCELVIGVNPYADMMKMARQD
jgi:hypothetical protein